MVIKCAASSKLALPVIIQNVFRSQLNSGVGAASITPCHKQFQYHHPLSPRGSQSRRSFSVLSRLRNSQSENTDHTAPEAVNSADATSPPQRTRKAFDAPGGKSGWNTHKRQPNGQRSAQEPNEEGRTGRTDKARKAFRNESRREAKKLPRDWEAERLQAREEFEKQKRRKPENWRVQKAALKDKFEGGWNPPKKLSPDALDGIRHLHAKAPEQFTTAVLAQEFEMSPEAIRRILKSKWRPSEDEMESRRKRWEKRHDRIWSRMAELGLRPTTKSTQPVADYHVLYKDDRESS
jgi:hypothetical protein